MLIQLHQQLTDASRPKLLNLENLEQVILETNFALNFLEQFTNKQNSF